MTLDEIKRAYVFKTLELATHAAQVAGHDDRQGSEVITHVLGRYNA